MRQLIVLAAVLLGAALPLAAAEDDLTADQILDRISETMEPEQIVAFSDAWLALSKRDVKVAQILALGERILFVWQGKAYAIEP